MALRELYQNAYDNEKKNPKATVHTDAFSHPTDQEHVDVLLSNDHTTLDKKTLLLGETTKDNDKDALGQFGEGYKLAILVLTREHCTVDIHTGNEIWHVSFKYDKRFNADVLTIDIQQLDYYIKSLIFEITDIPVDIWTEYKDENLYLQADYAHIDTDRGEVLTDPINRGKIFIGGLYVSKYSGNTLYGYNFNVGILQLGRDRNIVDSFDASWHASQILANASMTNNELLKEVIESNFGTDDSQYISHHIDNDDKNAQLLLDGVWSNFISQYKDSFPVMSLTSMDNMNKKYVNGRFIVVKEDYYAILCQSTGFKEAQDKLECRAEPDSPEIILQKFYDKYLNEMETPLALAFIKELKAAAINWEIKK